MNCKPGDLAVIVAPSSDMDGWLVTCLSLCYEDGRPYWLVDRELPSYLDGVWDSVLRPIRDQPGKDETLTWAPVPTTERQTA